MKRFLPGLLALGMALAAIGWGVAGEGEAEKLKPSVPESEHSSPPGTVPKDTGKDFQKAGHPEDSKAFGGHWYKVFDRRISWHEAKKACEEMGGYLACIETKEEQDFLAALADGKYLFLGATNENKEEEWLWVNGSKFSFSQWLEGQPNNYGGSEHYLATYDGGEWVDVDREGDDFWMPTGFLCEWDR